MAKKIKEIKPLSGKPAETFAKAMLTKEAIASCELDGETHTFEDMTIEPKENICCEGCFKLGKQEGIQSEQKRCLEILEKLTKKMNDERNECDVDPERKGDINFKGFCVECEGRTFAVKIMEELKAQIKGVKNV